MRLSDRQIAALPLPERGQKLYTDDLVPGFGIRVSQGGSKTFVLTYAQERRRVTLGRYGIVSLHAARERAKSLLAKRQLGLDQPASPRFADVVEEFLAERDKKVRKATRSRDGYMLPLFKSLDRKRVAEIEPAEVQRILDRIDAPWTKHDALIRFGLVIQYAKKQGYLENWPLHRLNAAVTHIPRDRVLDTAELRQVLATALIWRSAGNPFGTIVEILAYTGQRRQQIGSLHRHHIDFDGSTICWEPDLMKTGKRHVIPLGSHVCSLLDAKVNGLYFPNCHGDGFSAWSANMRKFKLDVGFDDWCLHDLRRVLATGWQDMGIDIAVTERMLSHNAILGGLVGVYQRSSYLTQLRAAVEKWETFLAELC